MDPGARPVRRSRRGEACGAELDTAWQALGGQPGSGLPLVWTVYTSVQPRGLITLFLLGLSPSFLVKRDLTFMFGGL